MSNLSVLLAESDTSLSEIHRYVLIKEGFTPVLADNVADAVELLKNGNIRAVIADPLLPLSAGGENGSFDLLKKIRNNDRLLPVITLSEDNRFPMKKQAYLNGTDEFMSNRISPEELLMTLQSLLRRSGALAERKLVFPHTILDDSTRMVTIKDDNPREYFLPPKEFELLFMLLSTPGRIFTREQLMNDIWGWKSNSVPQTVDVHISRLRRRFYHNPDFRIVTARGIGYRAILTSSGSLSA